MRLLVTGGSGFLGQAVLERLQSSARALRIVVRDAQAQARLQARGLLSRPQDEVIVQDLCQRFALPRLLEGCDAVLHLAGRTRALPQNRKAYFAEQVTGTAWLLEAALAQKMPRVVMVSPAHTLGRGSASTPVTENSRWDLSDLRSDWIQASRLRELEALRASSLGLPVVFVNPTFCLGEHDPHDSVSVLLGPLLKGQAVVGPGRLNVVDVRDAAAGIVMALEAGGIGRRYILGGSKCTWQSLAERWCRLLGQPRKVRVMPALLLRQLSTLAVPVITDQFLNPDFCVLSSYDWHMSDAYARQTLLYQSRPLDQTLRDMQEALAKSVGKPQAR